VNSTFPEVALNSLDQRHFRTGDDEADLVLLGEPHEAREVIDIDVHIRNVFDSVCSSSVSYIQQETRKISSGA